MNEALYCSIILPVYNEKDAIRQNVRAICQNLSSILKGKIFELIIVDNGSDDGTETLMEEFISIREIVYIRIPEKGRGGALRKGFTVAQGLYVGVLSIDRAWDEGFLPRAIEKLENGADIVYGPKTHPESSVKRPPLRSIGSITIRLILFLLFGKFFSDSQCIKVFRASAVPFIGELNNYNYFAETEFFLRGMMHGIPSVGIPVKVRDFRKESKVRISSLFEFLFEAKDFKRKVWTGKIHS